MFLLVVIFRLCVGCWLLGVRLWFGCCGCFAFFCCLLAYIVLFSLCCLRAVVLGYIWCILGCFVMWVCGLFCCCSFWFRVLFACVVLVACLQLAEFAIACLSVLFGVFFVCLFVFSCYLVFNCDCSVYL